LTLQKGNYAKVKIENMNGGAMVVKKYFLFKPPYLVKPDGIGRKGLIRSILRRIWKGVK